MSFSLKINPKRLHLQAIWKQDDPSHYYYHIILQNLLKQKSGSLFCTFLNTLKCKHFRPAPKAIYTTVSSGTPVLKAFSYLGTSSPPPLIRWTSSSMARKYLTVTLRNVRAFDALSIVLIHMSSDQHHNYIIAFVMLHQTCRVLWVARDQSFLSAWWQRTYTSRFGVFVPQTASGVHDYKQTILQG